MSRSRHDEISRRRARGLSHAYACVDQLISCTYALMRGVFSPKCFDGGRIRAHGFTSVQESAR
eukprot:6192522-Pleurochrysis_carterae.AAC.1